MSARPEDRVPELVRDAIAVYRDDPVAVGILEAHARRLEEPVRIAVAGMVKAGKSTLINALLGEEVAPTDTGECTRTVTWYRYGESPAVTVIPIDGKPKPLPIRQTDGRPLVDLGGIRAEDVERVEVQWPAESLRDLILIDTPGIASLSGEISDRSNRFLIPDEGSPEADAIVYVLRHLRQADLAFLKSFRDASGAQSGTVNALVVLSRADEIGAGRIGSLLAARNIAKRYRDDEALRSVAIGVLPVAGRLAQTARTLQQWELDALIELTRLDRKARERLLISADRFVQAAADGSEADRVALLDRFGLFGVRLSTVLIQNGFSDLQPLAQELARRSGLDDLEGLVATHFRMRSSQLKARTAISAVEAMLHQRPRSGTEELAAAVEAITAEAHELRELRLLATAHTAGIDLEPELTTEMLRLVGGEGVSPAERLGLERNAPRAEVRSQALSQVQRWRTRAEHPLTDRATAELCRIVVRSCEGILAQTGDGSGSRSTTRLFLGAEPGARTGQEAEHQASAGER